MSRQAIFYNALFSDEAQAPSGIHTWNGSNPATRFAVYRNNVLSSLINALADSYPVVQALVGEAFFRAMAMVYVQAQPPRSRLLVQYGDDLADFIDAFEPARQVPYLGDVARLEALRIQAYHAADMTPLSHEQLGQAVASSDDPARLVFALHPSLAVLSSPFAARSLWAAHQGELAIESVDAYRAEHCLVLRQHLDVLVIAVDAASAAFVTRLQAGQALGQATAEVPSDFNLSACLALLISHGAITALYPLTHTVNE